MPRYEFSSDTVYSIGQKFLEMEIDKCKGLIKEDENQLDYYQNVINIQTQRLGELLTILERDKEESHEN